LFILLCQRRKTSNEIRITQVTLDYIPGVNLSIWEDLIVVIFISISNYFCYSSPFEVFVAIGEAIFCVVYTGAYGWEIDVFKGQGVGLNSRYYAFPVDWSTGGGVLG